MAEVRDGYKMTEIGEIPIEWITYRLDEVVDKITDGAHKTPNYRESGVPFLRVTDIQKKYIDWDSTKYISVEEHMDLIKRCFPEKGDLLLSKNGTIGIVKKIDWENEFSIFVSLCLIKAKKVNSEINMDFLAHFLKSSIAQKQFKFSSKQGTVTNLHLVEIKNCVVPICDLTEQQKIAEILSTVDEQIEQTEMLIEKTKELKKGLMQQLLTKGIGHTEFKQSELGEIPANWNLKRVEDIADITTGNKDTKDKVDGGRYNFYVRSQTVEKINSYSYEGEAVLTAGDGVGVGKVFHYVNEKFDYHQRVYKMSAFQNVDGKFFYYYFSSNFYNQVRKFNAKTSVDSVRREMISKMLFRIPPIEEQKKIASILSTVDEQIESYEKEKAKYEKLKKGLMQQLLTGKVRVKVD